jgi:hypothetical protein
MYCYVLPKKPAYSEVRWGQQLRSTQQALEKLVGSRHRLTMEIQLEGVFYVVRPDAISRQLPVTSSSSERDTVEYSSVPGVD